jgi:hypothetical protein
MASLFSTFKGLNKFQQLFFLTKFFSACVCAVGVPTATLTSLPIEGKCAIFL